MLPIWHAWQTSQLEEEWDGKERKWGRSWNNTEIAVTPHVAFSHCRGDMLTFCIASQWLLKWGGVQVFTVTRVHVHLMHLSTSVDFPWYVRLLLFVTYRLVEHGNVTWHRHCNFLLLKQCRTWSPFYIGIHLLLEVGEHGCCTLLLGGCEAVTHIAHPVPTPRETFAAYMIRFLFSLEEHESDWKV